MELISLTDMEQHERDKYLVLASAKICRGAGIDMPDDVVSDYMFFSEKRLGYQLDILDTVLNCLAFTLYPQEIGDKDKQAMSEMLSLDCEDEEVTNSIIMQLITYRNYALIGKAPKIK